MDFESAQREWLGILMIFTGAALGLYVGIWVCLIGGIVDIIEAIKATETEAMAVAIGVVKIVFAGAVGSASALMLMLPGQAMLKK